jgi:hypothetical protein
VHGIFPNTKILDASNFSLVYKAGKEVMNVSSAIAPAGVALHFPVVEDIAT